MRFDLTIPKVVAIIVALIMVFGFLSSLVTSIPSAHISGDLSSDIIKFHEYPVEEDIADNIQYNKKFILKDEEGKELVDMYARCSSSGNKVDLVFDGSSNGITSLDVAQYIPKDSSKIYQSTLLIAVKVLCPQAGTAIQFIKLISTGYGYYISSASDCYSDRFPDTVEEDMFTQDSDGNTISELINWTYSKVTNFIDKELNLEMVSNATFFYIGAAGIPYFGLGKFGL